jgi:hypothetical protein
MEGHHHQNGVAFTFVTIMSTILTWVTLVDAQYVLSFVLTCMGIISASLAIRYYWYAGNLKRNQIKDKYEKMVSE